MRLRYSRKFAGDLEDIADYLTAQVGGEFADDFVGRVEQRVLRLLGAPNAYPIWQPLPDLRLRRFSIGRYLVFYRVENDIIELVRIVHGARDLRRIFGDEA